MQRAHTREARYRTTDVPGAAPLVPLAAKPAGLARRIGRGVLTWFKSLAITVGAAYVLGWAGSAVLVSAVATRVWQPPAMSNTLARIATIAPMRQFVLPSDPAISPADAGEAFFRMGAAPRTNPRDGFTFRVISDRPDAPWRHGAMAPGLFGKGRSNSYNGPDPYTVLGAARRGLNRDELALLRTYATAPVWRDFDRVARAPAIDYLGGRLVLPFGPDARSPGMPIVPFAATKELAYAGVARAAWYLSQGQMREAEDALRAIVSVGFAMVDNGTFAIDQLIGNVIVNVGARGLAQFYAIAGDPRRATVDAVLQQYAHDRGGGIGWGIPQTTIADARAAMVAKMADPHTLPAERFEMLYAYRSTVCTNVRELVAGPSAETRAAFDAVRNRYVRYPSERALVDLIETDMSKGLSDFDRQQFGDVATAAEFVSRIYFNPRLATCALNAWFGPTR